MHPTNFNVDVARFCVSLHEVNPERIVILILQWLSQGYSDSCKSTLC